MAETIAPRIFQQLLTAIEIVPQSTIGEEFLTEVAIIASDNQASANPTQGQNTGI
jgi:hypothetical protein